jgi:hypothetical protein
MMTIIDILAKAPTSLVLGALGIIALLILLIPIALRLAGLTGAQIADTLNLTLQFFINIVREFRAQNKET